MATKQQLRARWETPEGLQKREVLYQAFRSKAATPLTKEQLHELMNTLPYADEVSPRLDLRGLQLTKDIFVRNLDLPGVRLDYSALRGNLSDGNWSGAVFDEADVTRINFSLDLSNASFIKADARKAWFTQSILTRADFNEAKLIGAYLKEVPCNGASFRKADMRSSSCVKTDFRGADLTEANLSSAALGGLLFDEDTIVRDADFTGTALDDAFEAFIARAGAKPKVNKKTSDDEVATFDATLVLLQESNRDGSLSPLITTVAMIRQHIKEDVDYDWEPLLEPLSPQLQEIFWEAYEEGMGRAEFYM